MAFYNQNSILVVPFNAPAGTVVFVEGLQNPGTDPRQIALTCDELYNRIFGDSFDRKLVSIRIDISEPFKHFTTATITVLSQDPRAVNYFVSRMNELIVASGTKNLSEAQVQRGLLVTFPYKGLTKGGLPQILQKRLNFKLYDINKRQAHRSIPLAHLDQFQQQPQQVLQQQPQRVLQQQPQRVLQQQPQRAQQQQPQHVQEQQPQRAQQQQPQHVQEQQPQRAQQQQHQRAQQQQHQRAQQRLKHPSNCDGNGKPYPPQQKKPAPVSVPVSAPVEKASVPTPAPVEKASVPTPAPAEKASVPTPAAAVKADAVAEMTPERRQEIGMQLLPKISEFLNEKYKIAYARRITGKILEKFSEPLLLLFLESDSNLESIVFEQLGKLVNQYY
jgi:hypothetical protein